MKALITVGCMTDHGGMIILGDFSFLVEGKAVHLDGMTHYCPRCKVQSRAIASNQGIMIVGGKSIVAVSDTSTCGSKYLKISDLAVMNNGISNSKIVSNNTNSFVSEPKPKYGQRFLLQDQITNEPLANVCYEIHQNGEIIHGTTDKDGYTKLITSNEIENIELRIISKEHSHDE
ncbi:PAAR domain-containing protein [Acinetobacter ursingii]|uniref:PAAR domain-containing protein n=1 Tax=Acinetobacter ursingii TaxID=108980 RepID=UPI000CC8DD8E|nr:PAAR domain-containing protein [Acinetobacter ursingii]MCU4352784.1 PAAR domain-containing protein [Acinetobacter ursingii]PMC97304.1 PAAR domain-containing protein [Acinetobacter ursingii]PPZ93328.1 PAAR domain-containing protein [Acinetobacter ursingii]THD29675.1 MAG: PAAR domain-containing protein [Flavobacterium johnsoniae]